MGGDKRWQIKTKRANPCGIKNRGFVRWALCGSIWRNEPQQSRRLAIIPSPQGLQCSDYNHCKFTLNCKWPPHIVSKWQWLYTIQLFICVSYDWQISASNFQWRHNGLRWRIKLMQNTPTASLFYCRARAWLHRKRVCYPSGSSWS